MADGNRWLDMEDEEEWDRYRENRTTKRGESRDGENQDEGAKPRRRQRPRARTEQPPPELSQPVVRRYQK